MLPDNINGKCREYINNMAEYYEQEYLIDDEASFGLISINIREMIENKNNKVMYIRGLVLFSIIVSDAYKVLEYKFKSNTLSKSEVLLYDMLKANQDIEEIFYFIKYDRRLFNYLVKSTYDFYNMNSLGKRLLIQNLGDNENEHLNKLCVTHEFDLATYKKPLTKDTIIKIYASYKKEYQFDLNTISYTDEEIIKMISSYIKKLYDINIEEYERIVSSLIDNNADNSSIEELIGNLVKKSEYSKK